LRTGTKATAEPTAEWTPVICKGGFETRAYRCRAYSTSCSAELLSPMSFCLIAQAVEVRSFDEAVLVTDYPKAKVKTFEKLSSPTDFGDIYRAAVKICERVIGENPAETALTLGQAMFVSF